MLEKDVINEVLVPQNPIAPGIIKRLEWQPHIDSTGDESLKVRVIIEEIADEEVWSKVRPVEDRLRERLLARGVEAFPYFYYITESELAVTGDTEDE